MPNLTFSVPDGNQKYKKILDWYYSVDKSERSREFRNMVLSYLEQNGIEVEPIQISNKNKKQQPDEKAEENPSSASRVSMNEEESASIGMEEGTRIEGAGGLKRVSIVQNHTDTEDLKEKASNLLARRNKK